MNSCVCIETVSEYKLNENVYVIIICIGKLASEYEINKFIHSESSDINIETTTTIKCDSIHMKKLFV